MTYARNTTLSAMRPTTRSRRTLERYGADGFAYATQGNLATVIFAMENRVRIAPWVHRFSDVESFHHWLNLLMPTSSQANPLSNKLSSYSGFSSMARL